MASNSVQYENGNIFSPVLVLGDDPSNGTEGYEDQDNVIISRLPNGVSVPRNTVSKTEGTAEADTTEETASA